MLIDNAGPFDAYDYHGEGYGGGQGYPYQGEGAKRGAIIFDFK